MPRRKLVIEVLDDGQSVTLRAHREETIGNVEIGPFPVIESSVLSFPEEDSHQWQRDMVVLVLERL